MNIELKITLATAIIGGIKWVYEYTKQLSWERNKYLIERLDIFKSKDAVKKMQLLLDWNAIKIEIDGVETKVDDDILYEAFQIHKIKTSFTPLEADLRAIFDEYFDSLTELLILSDIGLIDKDKLEIYLKYYFDILKGKKGNKPTQLINQIHDFLKYYGYEDLYNFLNNKI